MFSEFSRMLSSFFSHTTKGGQFTKIDSQTDPIAITFPETEPILAQLEIAFGDLTISDGSDMLMQGTITYNVEEWKPEIIVEDGKITLKQGQAWSMWPEGLNNTWDLQLGTLKPYALTIHKGFAKAVLALGGIPLTNLDVEIGAGDTTLGFDRPNPEIVQRFHLKSGAGRMVTTNLLNLRARDTLIEMGAGEAILRFTGEPLEEDTHVSVKMGAGETRVDVQSGIPTQVTVSKALGAVKTLGDFRANLQPGRTICQTANFDLASGPRLIVEVNAAVGSVTLNTVSA